MHLGTGKRPDLAHSARSIRDRRPVIRLCQAERRRGRQSGAAEGSLSVQLSPDLLPTTPLDSGFGWPGRLPFAGVAKWVGSHGARFSRLSWVAAALREGQSGFGLRRFSLLIGSAWTVLGVVSGLAGSGDSELGGHAV